MEKVLAALRSAWAHVLAAKAWLATWKWTLAVNGWHGVLAVVALAVLLSVVWYQGRLSVRDARAYAVSLLAEPASPLAMPDARIISNAALASCEAQVSKAVRVANAWRDRAMQPKDVVIPAACKPKVIYKYVRRKPKTLLDELGF